MPAPASDATWSSTTEARRVEGTVQERDTGSPIGNVDVAISDIDLHARTNGAGVFRLDDVPIGSHIVRVQGAAYHEYVDTLQVTSVEGWRADVRMAPQVNLSSTCHAPFPITP
jgi:hypothetical protein